MNDTILREEPIHWVQSPPQPAEASSVGTLSVEARQLAFVEKLTRAADRRAADAERQARRLCQVALFNEFSLEAVALVGGNKAPKIGGNALVFPSATIE